MRSRTVLALAGATAVAAAASGAALAANGNHAASSGPPVTIRIEGASKTLLLSESVRGRSGWITKYGAPTGKCPGTSAQGALDVATHGDWQGKWYSSYNEYLITSIDGEKPSGSNFWEIFVNNRAASKGACDIKLRRGQQLLVADTSGKLYPSLLKVLGTYTGPSATQVLVRLTGYDAHGNSKPLAGVPITGQGVKSATTDSRGEAKVTDRTAGKLVLRASPSGYIRSEATVRVGK